MSAFNTNHPNNILKYYGNEMDITTCGHQVPPCDPICNTCELCLHEVLPCESRCDRPIGWNCNLCSCDRILSLQCTCECHACCWCKVDGIKHKDGCRCDCHEGCCDCFNCEYCDNLSEDGSQCGRCYNLNNSHCEYCDNCEQVSNNVVIVEIVRQCKCVCHKQCVDCIDQLRCGPNTEIDTGLCSCKCHYP